MSNEYICEYKAPQDRPIKQVLVPSIHVDSTAKLTAKRCVRAEQEAIVLTVDTAVITISYEHALMLAEDLKRMVTQ